MLAGLAEQDRAERWVVKERTYGLLPLHLRNNVVCKDIRRRRRDNAAEPEVVVHNDAEVLVKEAITMLLRGWGNGAWNKEGVRTRGRGV